MQANNNKFFNNNKVKRQGYVPLNDRVSKEWDMRFSLTDELTVTQIVDNLRACKDQLVYCLISGVEFGKSQLDRPARGGWFDHEPNHHVHVAIVTLNAERRDRVLKMVRPKKVGGEYCMPRKQDQTYIGWRLHHNKADTKIGSRDPLWEYGTLPMDAFTTANGLKILRMVRLHGTDEDKIKYKGYMDLGRAELAQKESERKRKINVELEELRKRLRLAEDVEGGVNDGSN